ncbi:DUF7576 family protein [Haladaptatus cibarius]|uniref:DUF7576 family protein n=1 Tax=Haladaptatus cibarius TaxID=453847 RepID=UPI0006793628|nr:hypothetical protein [Haladaptatus cibarius]
MNDQRIAGNGPEIPGDESVCTNCGDTIEIESWHPVLAETDATGSFHLYPFCSPHCRDLWNRTRPTDTRE